MSVQDIVRGSRATDWNGTKFSTAMVEEVLRDELLGITDHKAEITKELVKLYQQNGEFAKYEVPEGNLGDWLAWKWAFQIDGDD